MASLREECVIAAGRRRYREFTRRPDTIERLAMRLAPSTRFPPLTSRSVSGLFSVLTLLLQL